jgi:glycosyltransferase involved in cell wall biosynthesis
MNTKVSIIIPTYNRSELLLETLESVRRQSYKDWECIIIDDGSVDNTKTVVSQLVSKDLRFQFFEKPKKYVRGASSSRNYGFEMSKGKYIQWLDDDDLISENKIELQVIKLENSNYSNAITCCDWDFLWNGKEYEVNSVFKGKTSLNCESFFYELRTQLTFVPLHAYLMPRKIILKSGIWNVNLSLNDDGEFLTRVLLESNNLVNTVGCYVLYREHNNERISRVLSVNGIESFLFSLQLMSVNLKFKNIRCIPYFRWKLFNIFHKHWEDHPEILKRYYFFFKENGINLKYSFFYKFKYVIYKRIFPWYKRNYKKK